VGVGGRCGPLGGLELAAPASQPAGAGPMKLHHWLYGVTPGEGYGIKSYSAGLNIALFEAPLREKYTPIRGDAVQGVGGVNSRMIHPASSGEDILLSKLGKGPPDEMGRPTFQNHITVIPRAVLAEKRLTLSGVEAAVAQFDLDKGSVVGEMPALEVPPAPADWRLGAGLRQHVTRAAVETVATRRISDPEARTLLLSRDTMPAVRNEVLYRLIELLVFKIGLKPFVAMSDAPTASALNTFNLVVAPRGVRADGSWGIIETSMEAPALPRISKVYEVYEAIEQSYAADTAAFG